jgi:hypothetical protein
MIQVPEKIDDSARAAAAQLQSAYRGDLRDGIKL